jgi:hypothetical protein
VLYQVTQHGQEFRPEGDHLGALPKTPVGCVKVEGRKDNLLLLLHFSYTAEDVTKLGFCPVNLCQEAVLISLSQKFHKNFTEIIPLFNGFLSQLLLFPSTMNRQFRGRGITQLEK